MDQAQILAWTNIGGSIACVAATARLIAEATEHDVSLAFDGIAEQLTALGATIEAQIAAAEQRN